MTEAGERLIRSAKNAREKPVYDFGTHECLDRTFLVMELLDYVMEHPRVKANLEWSEMAEGAHQQLYNLYQSIGQTASGEPCIVFPDPNPNSRHSSLRD